MASVVSTKTRKLDAICAKLKLISNDLPLSLPGLPSSSTPCRPEPLTRASFDNSSPINFSLATKTGENEVVGIPGGELPENSPIPLQMESEKETDPLIVNDKEDDATSESCRDPEGQVLSLAIRKYENDDINTRNSVSESSPNNVTSSECDKEEGLGCENNNNDTTDKQSHDLISCNSDESTSKGVELSKKNGEDGSKSFLENGEEDNVCRNEMSAGTSSIKPSTLSSVPTPTPSPISTPTVSALSTPTISSQQKVSGASRRKSRKATPRNISQVREFIEQYDRIDDKDELAQYELNNQNTTFPPPENDEEYMDEEENARTINENMDTGENLSVVRSPSIETSITSTSSINDSCSSLNLTAKSSEVRNSRKNRKPQMAPSFSVPLDLSVGRTEMDDFMDSDSSEFEYSMDGDEVSLRSESGRNSPEDLRLSTSKDKPSVPKTTPKNSSKQDNLEISALKDYAENTMNELLQMYGLSRSADSITGQVHPENFSSNKILAHGGPGVIGKDKFRPILPKNFQLDPAVNGFVDTQLGQTQTTSLAGKAGIYVNYVNTHVSKAGKQSEEANKQQDKFTNSAAYIKAVFNHQSKVKTNSQGKILLPDYSKYLKRFNNGQECKVKYCHELGYREHFHCMDCNFRVFVKKEEMVRHFKWHRKREESLQHGFMRYSPMDDCSQKFVSCTHNGRQTHYHCLQGGCDKVYISTSDVQMHANYHRKDSAIIQEGFQRFRATEDCGTPSCAFYGQRTTHFHCRRPTCNFTFKNKADMEKHKTYHQKDEVLAKDGFKKFMKYEHCGYMSCRYSKVSNHIHCIRSGCNYVLHSTAQLYSHKRKHERRDFESAYRKFRDDQQDNKGGQIPGMIPGTVAPSRVNTLNNVSLMSNQQSMSLPVAIKREALDDFDSNDSKRFKTEQPSMSLPVSIKQEAFDDSESNESKLMQEDQPENLNENSFSDVKSESSESDTAMDVSHHDLDSDSGKDDATDVPETFYSEPKASTMAALNLTGVKLSDSLTLPIPTMHLMDEIKVTSPQEVTPVRQHLQLPVQIPTSVSSMATSLATPASSPAICQPVTTATSVALPARPPIMEKRERDESWKSYLIRYTANDPCNSRCQYLYKDHYHCKVEGCLVLFKSKDGVREHARFHELQDRITPVAYHVYEPLQACPNSCQYSLKEKHYHCIWSGCTHVVPHIGPTFGRLEHYRIHEYARASQGKTYKFSGSKLEDNSPRRRGRPPKYPKIDIPIIPKVELSEEEIAQSTQKIAINSAGLPKVINGFKMFEEREECPDELCIYRQQQHYHCARPRCHHATDRLDVLNLHAKDFHNFVTILEGFEFFDRNVNCRRNHCNNNKINRHFHCVKPKCDYSFVRHSTMMQHDKKHRTEGATELKPLELIKKEAAPTVSVPGYMPIIPALSPSPLESVNKGIIKTSGTFFPWSGLSKVPGTMAIPTLTTQLATQLSTVNSLQAVPVAVPNMALVMPTVATVSAVATPIITQGLVGANVPLSMLLQQKGSNSVPQRSWQELKESMHFDINQNCGRPFCKLKKKDHFHCFDCNQAFSDPSRLRVHICKHGIKINKSEEKPPVATPISVITPTKVCATGSEDYPPEGTHLSDPDEEDEDELNGSSSLNLEFSTFSSMIAKAQQAHSTNAPPKSNTDGDPGLGFSGKLVIDERFHEEKSGDVLDSNDNSLDDLRQDDLIDGASGRKSGRKRTATKRNDFVDSNSIHAKQKKSTSPRSGKDDSIPDGYTRIKQKEDCQHEKCAYRQGVTHFHCIREDCGYSFSDRSRLIQHTLRHERIDSLTGGEMRQYRMNQSCNLENCEYQGKASHFHCLKCDYCCTDSSKVLTHRKHHSKMDSISSQGFVKASIEDDCGVALCQYNMKQTHYHCTRTPCNYAVLGPAQMSSHKIKHAS